VLPGSGPSESCSPRSAGSAAACTFSFPTARSSQPSRSPPSLGLPASCSRAPSRQMTLGVFFPFKARRNRCLLTARPPRDGRPRVGVCKNRRAAPCACSRGAGAGGHPQGCGQRPGAEPRQLSPRLPALPSARAAGGRVAWPQPPPSPLPDEMISLFSHVSL